jgi:hypothetical protein
MGLAHKLGVEALHEICLTKLYTAASDSIQNASVNNIPLRTLLGYGPGPTDDVVEVVFKNVIKDHNTPKRLQDLFIETFANNIDMELWLQVKPLFTLGMVCRVLEAIIIRQHIKTELYDEPSFKSESEEPPIEQSTHID